MLIFPHWSHEELQSSRKCAFYTRIHIKIFVPVFSFFKDLFIFRKRGREEERGRETSLCERYMDRLPLTHPLLGTWPATRACALTGNRTGNSSVHRPALNPLSHTSQGNVSVFHKSQNLELAQHPPKVDWIKGGAFKQGNTDSSAVKVRV